MFKHILSILTACLLLCGAAQAQDLIIKRVDTSDWPTVRVLLEAPGRDAAKNFAMTLTSQGGTQTRLAASDVQEITTSPSAGTMAVAVDTSRSLKPADLQAIKDSVTRYAKDMDSHEQLALITFEDDVELVTNFTTNHELFANALSRIRLEGNYTELNTAMAEGLELMKNMPGRRALLVITDGKDEGSNISREQVIRIARSYNIPILAIGMATLPGTESDRYLPALQNLAEATGGVYRPARNATELHNAAYELMLGERERTSRLYEAVFAVPTDLRTGRDHTLHALVSRDYRGYTQAASMDLVLPANIGRAAGGYLEDVNRNEMSPPPGVKTVDAATTSQYLAKANETSPVAVAERDSALLLAANDPARTTDVRVEDHGYSKLLWGLLILLLFLGLLYWMYSRRPKNPAPGYQENTKALLIEFPELQRTYRLRPGTMVMGSHPGSDIALDDPSIASAHAEFCSGSDCRVTNLLASRNLLLNGKQLDGSAVLKPGDELVIGNTKAIIRAEGQSRWSEE